MSDRLREFVERARARLHPPDAPPELRIPFATRAAVLMPLFLDDEGELSVWLLRKTEGTRRHAGQVALPGGKSEPHDLSLLETALREADEEIKLPRDAVEVIGVLDPYPTITGFVMTPFVGVLDRPFTPVPDQVEVARAFPARLATFAVEGEPREVSVLTWRRTVPAYEVAGEIVWGATAAILQDAAKRLLG